MKVYVFIPARYPSTRFPGKPLALISGKPMIQRVYERAVDCARVSEVIVATDDRRIFDCVRGFDGKVLLTDGAHASGTDRVAQAALMTGLEQDDIVVNIQGDQPLFDPEIIPLLITPLEADPTIVMSTLMYRIRDGTSIQNPNHVKVVTDRQGFALYFSRHAIPYHRDFRSPGMYFKHLGVYGFRMSFLIRFTRLSEGILESAEKLEQLRALEHGFRIKVLESPVDSIEVDVPEDILRVERIIGQQG
ncbi:MAG: 3-deoxy-manno-octulosonate cytidylyltransferase [Deltaproteobacteria bacterium]|nr:MAG: 3-deoxy-manno-octulosonate cytidylyltransferase [Deltaproteobacteria bacterium]